MSKFLLKFTLLFSFFFFTYIYLQMKIIVMLDFTFNQHCSDVLYSLISFLNE